MSRPCQHKEYVQGCHICFLVRTREDYRTLWGEPAPKCIYLGDDTGERVKCPTCRGNVELFVFSCLLHGKCTQGKKVSGIASCEHCRDKCTSRAILRDKFVVIPQPPDLQLTPRSARALVTVAVGKEGKELLEISRPFLVAYAQRVGADLVILDWPGHPDCPLSCKFGIGKVLDYYERIAFVDADTLLVPGCVNLFDICPEDSFAAFDELPFHKERPQHRILKSYLDFRNNLGMTFKDVPWQFNTGVMVIPRRYKELLLPPEYPLPVHHLSEQFHINSRVLDSGAEFFPLPRVCNEQWWVNEFKDAEPTSILHFSGMKHGPRVQEMKRWAAHTLFPTITPLNTIRFSPQNLFPELPGKRSNPSIVAHPSKQGWFILAFRNDFDNTRARAKIYLTELDNNFTPKGPLYIPNLTHPEAIGGKEDPRLFWHQNSLHLAFTGISDSKQPRASQLYSQLSESLEVIRINCPSYTKRRQIEKNWMFFSQSNILHAIYSSNPHCILQIEEDIAENLYTCKDKIPWHWGEIRGGTPPILYENNWWHFFHSHTSHGSDKRLYHMGVLVFESIPPFRVVKISSKPILSANWDTTSPGAHWASVFPGGAIQQEDKWHLAIGEHDHTLAIYSYNHKDIEELLISI